MDLQNAPRAEKDLGCEEDDEDVALAHVGEQLLKVLEAVKIQEHLVPTSEDALELLFEVPRFHSLGGVSLAGGAFRNLI